MLVRFASLLIMVVSVTAYAEQHFRAENAFFINGKNIEISPILQHQIRESWIDSGSGPFKSALSLADAQWVRDFISIAELVRKPQCKHLKLLNTTRHENKEDTFQGRVIHSGTFDEQWAIDACGETHIYRVFNEVGSQELSIYEMRLTGRGDG